MPVRMKKTRQNEEIAQRKIAPAATDNNRSLDLTV
jgi:hypothetical protein